MPQKSDLLYFDLNPVCIAKTPASSSSHVFVDTLLISLLIRLRTLQNTGTRGSYNVASTNPPMSSLYPMTSRNCLSHSTIKNDNASSTWNLVCKAPRSSPGAGTVVQGTAGSMPNIRPSCSDRKTRRRARYVISWSAVLGEPSRTVDRSLLFHFK